MNALKAGALDEVVELAGFALKRPSSPPPPRSGVELLPGTQHGGLASSCSAACASAGLGRSRPQTCSLEKENS